MIVLKAPGYKFLVLHLNKLLEISDTPENGAICIEYFNGLKRYVKGKNINAQRIMNKLLHTKEVTGVTEIIDVDSINRS